ncbi:MAG: hypothetical protein D6776_08535, partial [Planctomycetota bacterium]
MRDARRIQGPVAAIVLATAVASLWAADGPPAPPPPRATAPGGDAAPAAPSATARPAAPGDTLSAEFDWRKAAPPDDAVLVRIDGEPIRIGEYKDYLLGQFGDGYVQVFVNERLVEREARRLGVVATDERVRAWIEDKVRQSQQMPELQGMDWDELRRRYRPHARMGYLIETLVKMRRTSPEGLKREYAMRYGEKRRVRHILYQVRLRPGMPEDRRTAIEQAARERAERAVERLRKGADFAELARRESEDPASAARGGELPPFARPEMVPAFAEAAFSLPVGKISDPVRSRYGWHVIEVLEVIPAARPWSPELEAELRKDA